MENTILVLKVDKSTMRHELVGKDTGKIYLSADMVIIDDYPEIKVFMEKFKRV